MLPYLLPKHTDVIVTNAITLFKKIASDWNMDDTYYFLAFIFFPKSRIFSENMILHYNLN